MKERFEKKFIKTAACWEWQAAKNSRGYGKFSTKRGIWEYAHRISYMIYRGDFSQDLCVCHKCDNTSCVNPDHLFVGTYSDNNKDAYDKGRHTNPRMFGKDNPKFKFTDNILKEIKRRLDKGEAPKSFYKELGVHWGSIYKNINKARSIC